jgi:hypothetical protein
MVERVLEQLLRYPFLGAVKGERETPASREPG